MYLQHILQKMIIPNLNFVDQKSGIECGNKYQQAFLTDCILSRSHENLRIRHRFSF